MGGEIMTAEALITGPAAIYRAFIEALNRQDLDAATRLVNIQRYRENCAGFAHGFVGWEEAKDSIRQVWKGLPNLRVELDNVLSASHIALAHGVVRGTATGRLYGAPAPKRSFEANFFDYVKVDGLVVERIQQPDVLGQMRQLYGKAVGLVGLGAMFLAALSVHRFGSLRLNI
jgi:predicted ester cyclase